MTDTAEQVRLALIDALVEFASRRNRGADTVLTEPVLRHYFDRVPPQDITDKSPLDLYAAAAQHLRLAHERPARETLVHVYNPAVDEDGWSSTHTTIDVVIDDMPFIVDSVLSLLELRGMHVHVLIHPMFQVTRSESGQSLGIEPPGEEHPALESMLHLEIDRLAEGSELEELEAELCSVLADVRSAVTDWPAMRTRALELAAELDEWAAEADQGTARYQSDIGTDASEVAALLRWMEAGSFIFVGYREYDFVDDPNHPTTISRPETGLGVLRQREQSKRDLGLLPPETADLARTPTIVNLTKANSLSTVHRSIPLDYVGIKSIDANGRVLGERRIVGMFTTSVYSGRVEGIPVVREKVAAVIERTSFHQNSHDHGRLSNALQVHPRDELFQASTDELEDMILAILDLRDRRQVSFLLRRDTFGRFLSCLVFIPRDRHSTDLRVQIQDTLMETYHGTSCRYATQISSAPLARVHLVIYTDPRRTDELPDPSAVEARLAQATRTWDDFLRTTIIEAHGEDRGLDLLARYGQGFEASYRSDVFAETAVRDIDRLEALGAEGFDVAVQRPLDADTTELRCKLYRSGPPITLSQFMPILHDLGAVVTDERPYEVRLDSGDRRFIYDIGVQLRRSVSSEDRARVRDAVLAVWEGKAESDRLARLVVSANLSWDKVTVLRAYARYLVQAGIRFSSSYVMQTLTRHPEIAAQLVELFELCLHPELHDLDAEVTQRAQVFEAIDQVASLDADRILRSFVAVIDATVRTNHWQTDSNGDSRPALALKLDPRRVPDLPKPVPLAEIFVYSPRTEGVHLRLGRVARGGLRWSERMEDYRTEILGLMKAQSVKNSLIVPVGAKGGFIVRRHRPGTDRQGLREEVVACYSIFIGALLDVTDNVVEGAVVPPANVFSRDGEDPYLVVAADKGTATFSDIANGIATERGFWLGDAFASGGSEGFDHKLLGITARGGWVAVERHLREMGVDLATAKVRTVGIGDMSGDVFGNGMLRSDKIKLIAAFDHRHVFIDPAPDPNRTFEERGRLFALPRSSWDDVDRSTISPGGGVFPRTAKSIDITPQMQRALGIKAGTLNLSPDELIQAVLQAPVDLLWNGGIGTYVKARSETHADVGDRNNDNVRVDASDLRCAVVVEGGNLGVTQAGRVEFARGGGRINSDAVDNSAGVDCSDHEVNLKILLGGVEQDGDLTRKQRNGLLESVADTVCSQVLSNNYAQNETLSADLFEAHGMLGVHQQVIEWLEADAELDRVVEVLPSNSQIAERRENREALTRPELAVLLAYTKNLITTLLVDCDLGLDSSLDDMLGSYFPAPIVAQYPEQIRTHALRSELLATLISNDLVNRGGVSMAHRLARETSATIPDIARAHLAAWQIYDLDPMWRAVQDLDGVVAPSIQTELHLEIRKLGERASRWLLRNEPQPINNRIVVERYAEMVRALHRHAIATRSETDPSAAVIERLVGAGVPPALAEGIGSLGAAFGLLDLSKVAQRTGVDHLDIAGLHAAVESRLDLSWLRDQIISLPRSDHWETMARSALRDEFFREHAELTSVMLEANGSSGPLGPPALIADQWLASHAVAAERCQRTFAELRGTGERDLAHASVALRALSQLRRTT